MTENINHNIIIQNIYEKAFEAVNKNRMATLYQSLTEKEKEYIELICEKAESNRGVLTVFVTSLVQKLFDCKQDIRLHQDNMQYKNKRGYSGRGIDTKYITPFMKRQQFPSMAESGWLTRSLEQNYPYYLDYRGSIRPIGLKTAFLNLLHFIEEDDKNPAIYLQIVFASLIVKRDKKKIDPAKPTSLTIAKIISILKEHFEFNYGIYGASRLPTISIYSVYKCMMDELKRFNGKTLLPLEEHNSSDSRSGRVGDIQIHDENNRVFEAVEIKHNIQITSQLVRDSYEKFKIHPINRYYILTTADKITKENRENILFEIDKILKIHGCQVIVNGIYPSLKYYLRLLSDTFAFINYYVDNISIDNILKFNHKEKWNQIIASLA